jgi:hypothetical protein
VRGPGGLRKLGLVALSAGDGASVASFLTPHSAAAAISGTGGRWRPRPFRKSLGALNLPRARHG